MLLAVCAAVLLAVAGAVLLVWGLAYRRLAYQLTDSALRIEWLGRSVVVPYPAIQGIYTGQRLEGNASPAVPRWPGINVGTARIRGQGRLRFFATTTDQSLLTLVTVEHGAVVISARDANEFRAAIIDRVERYEELAPPSEAETWHQREPLDAPWTAFADVWFGACVLVGTVLALLILATIALRYDSLPDQLPLRFDVSSEASQIGPKSDLLRLPLLGFACLLLNWIVGVVVHPRERALARLLWLGACVVELVLLVAVIRLVTP